MKKNLLVTLIAFLTLLSCSDTENEISIRGKETSITSVDLKNADDLSVLHSSEIDTLNNTVTIVTKKGTTSSEKLKFSAVIPKGAISKPALNVLTDFSNPVNYTIISESRGTTSNWTVIVITENEEALITSIDDVKDANDLSVLVSSEIDTEKLTVSIVVKVGSDKKNLKLNSSISGNAVVKPALDVLTDFSNPVEYVITSEDGKTTNNWLISVSVEVLVDYDSGFDYVLDVSKWTLDESRSDNFNEWSDSKWNTFLSETSSGIFNYKSNNVSVIDDKLRLTVQKDGEGYSAGKVQSVFEIGENTYVKIRAKTVVNRAMINSFFSLYNEPNEGNNPNSKITLMKTLLGGTGLPNSFMSSLGQTNIPNEVQFIDSKTTISDSELSEDYHIYALERRSNYLRFFLNNEVIWEFETSKYPDLSNQLLSLIIGVDAIDNVEPSDSDLPGYLLIDYVEVYNAINTDLIDPTYSTNLVQNPGFEDDEAGYSPNSWTITQPLGDTKNGWTFQDASGQNESEKRYHLGHPEEIWAYDLTISQDINNLSDGMYRLEVWAYIVEGREEFEVARLFAKSFGNEEKSLDIDNVGPEWDNQSAWKKHVIDNIYVTNGTCEIGVQGVSPGIGLARLFIDNFSFYKVNYE